MNVGNIVDSVTANGDVSNVKHLIGETRWCFLKHKTLQVGEEITFTFCTTTSESEQLHSQHSQWSDLSDVTVIASLLIAFDSSLKSQHEVKILKLLCPK